MNGPHTVLGNVAHPDWCDEEECTVLPGSAGVHASRHEWVADRGEDRRATAVFVEQSTDSPVGPWLVVIRLYGGREGPSVRWPLGTARDLHAVVGKVLDRFAGEP